jgi:hypothetical protein
MLHDKLDHLGSTKLDQNFSVIGSSNCRNAVGLIFIVMRQ